MMTDYGLQDAYNARTRELFASPKHALLDAGEYTAVCRVSESAHGAQLQLMVLIADARVVQCHFRARACPHLIAACERWCTAVEGKSIAAIASFDAADCITDLGVPVEKTGRILLLEDAVRDLARQLDS
jgi:NifU-like protein involved in Fe-S cluster formation